MDKLVKPGELPETWFVQCKYCQDNNMLHERELLDKARKMCRKLKTSHLEAFVTAEMDLLDHSLLTPLGQIEILTAIHDKTGCDCLTAITEEVTEATHTATPDPSPQDTPSLSIPSHQHKPNKPRTLLERLKAGPSAQSVHPRSTRT